MLPRCGRAAHICEANYFFKLVFLLQLHFLKLTNSQFDYFMKQIANSDKATGQLQHAGRQKQGWNPLLPDVKDRFPRSKDFCKVIFRCNCSAGTVTRLLFTAFGKQGGAVLFAPPRKAVAFLTTLSVCQKHGTGISLPAGSDQGYSP